MTKDELKAALDELDVEYPEDAKKAELETLLEENTEDEEEPTDEDLEEAEGEEDEAPEDLEDEENLEGLVVKSNLKHNGTVYEIGTIFQGSPEDAARLKADGVLE